MQQNDPYKHDAAGRTVQNVIINLDKEMEPTVEAIARCLMDGRQFALCDNDSVALYDPKIKAVSFAGQVADILYFQSEHQMVNHIKLMLVTHKQIIVPPQEIEEKKIILLE